MVFITIWVMTFNQFKYLSEDDQESLLWKRGVEIGRKTNAHYHYILYQVDGFYMEIQCAMLQGTIMQIACFEDVDLLEPYLRKINISWLYTT